MYPWNPVLLSLKSFRVCNPYEVKLAEGGGVCVCEIVYGTKTQTNKHIKNLNYIK